MNFGRGTWQGLALALASWSAIGALNGQAAEAPAGEGPWKIGYKEPGGGFSFESPDSNFRLGFMGYIQANQKQYLSSAYHAQGDYPLAFSVKRARMDFTATLFKDYDLYMEYDGAPATSVANPANPSVFGLVEAKVTAKLLGDAVKLRLGKMSTPFSTEDWRSSRNLDTIERYMAMNSLLGLPSIDIQYGAMLMGTVLDEHLTWYAGVFNGNAKASANQDENNLLKELQLKVTYKLIPELTVGLGFDHDKEGAQTLVLKDLAGAAFNSMPVAGTRYGFSPDFYFEYGPLSLRGEWVWMKWSEAANIPTLNGGFLQAAYFVFGNDRGGFQPLVRFESAQLGGGKPVTAGATHLNAGLVGGQWFVNSGVREQLNLVMTLPNGKSTGVYANDSAKFAVLNEVQFRF
jgi:phosphate-selective porin